MLGFVSVRPFRWLMGVTPALVVALTLSVSAQSNRASQAPARWYDAYREGVAAVQRRDWVTAERRLLEARSSGQKPGRRVLMYGDSYTSFLPDYYIGVVYLNTNRAQEAEGAFERVRSQGIIGVRDPEYAAFERQGREATFNRTFVDAQQLVAKGDFTQASNLLNQARATKVDDSKVAALSREIAQQMAVVQKAPVQPAPSLPPSATTEQVQTRPAPSPVQPKPSDTMAGGLPNTYKAPMISKAVVKPKGGSETFPKQGVIVPPPPTQPGSSPGLQSGILAFFSGDYGDAVPLLQSAAQQPGMALRARAFLACAKAGLVLTGRADAGLLREARADFESADAMRNLTAAERRFISPRILEQLERP